MKKISVIGIGKLGLCFALNLEKCGYSVHGFDVRKDYVESLNAKTFISDEAYVNQYLDIANNIRFSPDDAIGDILSSNLIFIVVATPSLDNGDYDHAQIDDFFNKIKDEAEKVNDRIDFVICCTTMPGYCKSLSDRMGFVNHKISYNPEFIAQGTIINNQQYPDVILIGAEDNVAANKISSVYCDMVLNEPAYHVMSPTEAEITKIALNCFLTTKISFANMVGDAAGAFNCDSTKILSAIGSDSRIGNKYLKYGFGYGGPCFGRDNRAFGNFCKMAGVEPAIPVATDKSNSLHVSYYASHLKKMLGDDITFDYATYKKESTMLEDSQVVKTAEVLADAGVNVTFTERDGVINILKEKYGNKFSYENRTEK